MQILLRQLIEDKISIIENKNCDTNTSWAKKDAWREITSNFNNMSATMRETPQLQAQWRGTKMKAKMNASVYKKSLHATRGGPPPKSLDPEQERLMALIPHEFEENENEFDCDTKIQDDGGDIHGFSQPTLCQICKRVARALASKRSTYVKMPTSFSDQIRTLNQFFQIRRFPKVVGAIDCTHIKIPKVGGPSWQYYVNRKGYYSLNTQVVCDASVKIMDIVCRWRGSTHDSRIFRESRIKPRFEIGEFNGRLLGDGGYP